MKKTIGLIALTCFLFLVIGQGSAQNRTSKAAAKNRARERINSIIDKILKQGEFITAEGYRAISLVRPSNEDIEEVKRFGDDAIPVLEERMSSVIFREYELAMRLLAALGDTRIVEPLRKIIQSNSSSKKRETALIWITQAPWDQASKIISEAAERDPDAHVREVAKELLSGYGPGR